MKKIIGITLVVALFTMIGSVVSFFVFDFGNFIEAQTRHRNIGNRIITKAGEIVADIVLDEWDDTAEEYTGRIDKSMDQITEKIEEMAKSFAEGMMDQEFPFPDLMDDIYHGIFKGMGIKNGYMTEEVILKTRDSIVDKWRQSPEEIKNLIIDMKNINVVFAKTKSKELEFYLTSPHTENVSIVFNQKIEDGNYYVKDDADGFSVSITIGKQKQHTNSTLYVLVPDDFAGQIKTEILNGNVITVMPHNDTKVEITNGNVVLAEGLSCDLDVNITNGNIVADFTADMDAEVNVEANNGLVVGFGAKKSLRDMAAATEFQKIYGNAKHKVSLKTVNGNIIGY